MGGQNAVCRRTLWLYINPTEEFGEAAGCSLTPQPSKKGASNKVSKSLAAERLIQVQRYFNEKQSYLELYKVKPVVGGTSSALLRTG